MRIKLLTIIMIIGISIYSGNLKAQNAEILNENTVSVSNLFNSDRGYLTGQWNGFRTKMEENGITVNFDYTSDLFSNLSGGIKNESVYLDNYDFTFMFDLEKLIGFKNTELNLYFLGNSGDSPSEIVGDIQTLSNIDTDDTWKLYVATIEKKFYDEKFSIMGGLYDLNSEFDVIETGGLFLNSSHGIGPDYSQSGHNGPSIFPTTSLALRLKYSSENKYDLLFAVLDGVPGDPDNPYGTHIDLNDDDGFLLSSEFKYYFQNDESSKFQSTVLSLGGWYYTEEFDHISSTDNIGQPLKVSGNYGIYAIAESQILSEGNAPEQGLSIYARLGYADPKVNQFNYYYGGGLVYTGLISGRDEDQAGLSIANVRNGDLYLEANRQTVFHEDDMESSIELTYFLNLSQFISIQPDIQYIINPSMNKNIDNAFVVGCRFGISF